MKYEIQTLDLSRITLDDELQPRIKRNKTLSAQFIELLNDHQTNFPPLVVFQDESTYYLADGYHRYYAYVNTYTEKVACHVYQGTKRDALLFSVGANGTHGLNMTNADKRRAVMKLIQDPEWSQWSDRDIARRCHVDHTFVGKVRKSLVSNTSEPVGERTYINKQGQVCKMKVTQIGKGKPTKTVSSSHQEAIPSMTDAVDTLEELQARLDNALAEIARKEERIAELEAELSALKEQLGEGCEEIYPF